MAKKTEYRSRGTREEKPIVFVLGDGQSECTYFEDLNVLVDGIRIRAVQLKVTGWRKIIDKCDGFVRTGGVETSKDVVAVVTDEDGNYDAETMVKFQKECDRKGYRLCLSNISFEVWLLLHYEVPTRPMRQEELEERLSFYLGHKYVKTEGIPLTKELLEEAMRNSDMGQGVPKSGMECLERDPSTMVGGLIKYVVGI